MEKRKGVSKLIVAILLLMILMIYIVTSVELYKQVNLSEKGNTIISLLMNVVKQLLMWHLSSLERTALGFFRTSDMK